MRKIFVTFIVVFCTVNLNGQSSSIPSSLPNILPPSPDAYSFTKYGNVPIGLSSGTAQFTIPLYTIQSGSLKLPIGLNYSSNGVKVDEMATRVGLNWNLNAGGVITRVVLDKADEEALVPPAFYHGPIEWGIDNILHNVNGVTDYYYFKPEKWTFYNYVKTASLTNAPDFEPDEYSYNVDGYSGKFIRRENGEFTHLKSCGVKIEKNGNGFILTAPTGNRYFFYASEIAHNYTTEVNMLLESVPSDVPTAWYLTRIISVTNDTITLNYNSSAVSYINGLAQDLSTGPPNGLVNTTPYAYNCCVPEGFMCVIANGDGIRTSVLMSDNNVKYLESIDFNLGKVNFIYSGREDVIGEKKLDEIKIIRKDNNSLVKAIRLDYQYSLALPSAYDPIILGDNLSNTTPQLRKRLFLTAVNDLSNDLTENQQYQFEYSDINKLPSRLSFSQDHHGFFNGYVNDLFIPNDTWFDFYLANNNYGGDRRYNFNHAGYGMLKKIIYPTGGYTTFEYEPHKTNDNYAYTYFSDSTTAIIDTSTAMYQTVVSDTFHHYGYRELRIRYFCDWATAPVDLSHGNGGSSDILEDYHFDIHITNQNTGFTISKTLAPYENYVDGYFGINQLPVGIYKIELIANRPRMKARVAVIKSWRELDVSDTAGIAGLRVKSVTDYSATSEPVNKREFVYGDWTSSTNSSGTGLYNSGNSSNEVSLTRNYGGGFNTIHSNSIFNTFQSGNNTVVYRKVIELNTSATARNNGGKEYEFFFPGHNEAVPITYNWDCSPSYTNFAINPPTIPTRGNIWNPVPIVPPNAPSINNDFFSGLQKSVKTFTYQTKFGNRNILEESSNYFSLDTPSMMIDTLTVSKYEIKRVGTTIPTWIYLSDYIIFRYWRYFVFEKLDSTITVSYSGNNQLKNKIAYTYSMNTYLPNKQIFKTSDGKDKEILTRYISDIPPADPTYSAIYAAMVNANRINSTFDENTVKNTTNLSCRQMRYNYFGDVNLILPYQVFSKQLNEGFRNELTFNQYDDQGNLLQYTGKDGIVSSIIWGYNKTYPVAKIIGMGYEDAKNNSGINVAILNNLLTNDNAMRTELNKLRSLTGKVLVSTMTYSPLIGVTSETDANGKTVYYEYDNFNRLKLIRDKENNILKKICYNYQGQQTDCSETVTLPSACATCTGVNRKCINNHCETGVPECVSSNRTGSDTWTNTYRYKWPDGSYSQTFTVTQNHGCITLP